MSRGQGKAPDPPVEQSTGGMWRNDIVFGGLQLEPSVQVGRADSPDPACEYVLWNCGIVAENVVTSIGDDGTKAEVVISVVTADGTATEPMKFGTFASSIVSKIRLKRSGDLPAVVRFDKTESKFDTDAFVMTFIRKWDGATPDTLPGIMEVDPDAAPY